MLNKITSTLFTIFIFIFLNNFTIAQSTIFDEYRWIFEVTNVENCDELNIDIYQQGSSTFVYIQENGPGILYNGSGIIYCSDSPSFSCLEFYNFENAILKWQCGDPYEQTKIDPCLVLDGLDFGGCALPLGIGLVKGVCISISGCSVEVDNVDYSDAFFPTYELCIITCVDPCALIDCSDEYDPVCGTDGITYQNSCIAKCAGVEVAYSGTCQTGPGNDIFDDFPWVSNLIDPIYCDVGQITVYSQGNSNFVYLSSGVLYDAEGNVYCIDFPGFSCLDFYNFTTVVNTWICGDCVCTAEYDPVCGIDGVTYGNACNAFCAGVPVAFKGECDAIPCERPDINKLPWLLEYIDPASLCKCNYQIIYGCLDGMTVIYITPVDPSSCTDVLGLYFDIEGNLLCEEGGIAGYLCEDYNTIDFEYNDPLWTCDNCVCPTVVIPVCGIDGITYNNECEANCVGVEIAYGGVCEEDCKTPELNEIEWIYELTKDPIFCDCNYELNYACQNGETILILRQSNTSQCNDTFTYYLDLNGNILCTEDGLAGLTCPEYSGLQIRSENPIWECDLGCGCGAVYDPVCGIDGITYSNECEAFCAGVEVVSDEPCIDECKTPELESLDWFNKLVEDEFYCECSYELNYSCLDNETVLILIPGSTSICNDVFTYFFDLDGNELCLVGGDGGFLCPEYEILTFLNERPIWECKIECGCDAVYQPVCGIDGVTYPNECEAKCAGVEIQFYGPCEINCEGSIPVADILNADWFLEIIKDESICECDYQLIYGCGFADGILLSLRPSPNTICSDQFTYYFYPDGTFVCEEGGIQGLICPEAEEYGFIEDQILWSCNNDCICPQVFAPVCGVNGITYNNECEAQCEGIEIEFNGPCEINCFGSLPVNEVLNADWFLKIIEDEMICECDYQLTYGCGFADGILLSLSPSPNTNCSDQLTYYYYPNGTLACEEGGFQGTICPITEEYFFYEDQILWSCNNDCFCPQVVAPVCGVDGMTYGNSCEAACQNVEIAYDGPCKSNNIFNRFSWLSGIIDPIECSEIVITVYDQDDFIFVYIEGPNGGTLYDENGQTYCVDFLGFSCLEFYDLKEIVDRWACPNFNESEVMDKLEKSKFQTQLESKDLDVFPNPTLDEINVSGLTSGSQFSVINMNGEILIQKTVSKANMKIDMTSFPSGLYLIHNYQKETSLSNYIKFIKQ